MRRGGRLPLEVLQPYLVDVPAAPRKPATPAEQLPSVRLSWAEVFGNDHPVEIEVGCGKGLFLLTASEANPGINYLGVEIERKYLLYTATRLAKRHIGNVRLACADARLLLRDHMPNASVQAIHVYFPDPWWKKRHRKRRVFTADFAAQCLRVLETSGRLQLTTDVEEYFVEIQALLEAQPAARLLPAPSAQEPRHDFDYLTNFERKYRKAAKPIYRAEYEKK